MPRMTNLLLAGGLAGALLAAVGTGSAAAGSPPKAPTVHPGESIQTAIDAAPDGGTVTVAPGSYAENLLVTRPVTIRASGAVLTPPHPRVDNLCTKDDGGLAVGVCVLGELDLNGYTGTGPDGQDAGPPPVLAPVTGVAVVGLTVEGFDEGIESVGTDRLLLDHVTLRRNVNGALHFHADRTAYRHVLMTDSTGFAAATFHSSRDLRITNSRFVHNAGAALGIADVSGGSISANTISDNAAGLLLFDSPDPYQTGDLTIAGNQITDNTRCFDDGQGPVFSGIGVALLGTTGVRVNGNTITANTSTCSAVLGDFGVGLLDASEITGGGVPVGNTITGNRITGSATAVLDDGSGHDNVVRGNQTKGQQ